MAGMAERSAIITIGLYSTNSGSARNFHIGAVAQGAFGTKVPQWGPGAKLL